MRSPFLLALIVLILARIPFSQPDVQYAELVPQLIFDNADPDCQSFITYTGSGEPKVSYFIWDSKGSRENPSYTGSATCVGQGWESGKACHSGFFNPQPLSGVVHCSIEASVGSELAGKCSIAATACKNCPEGCGDGKCSGGENSNTCSQDCLFYGMEIKILEPECYTGLHRGEGFLLKVIVRKNGAVLKGAAVTATGFFGTAQLLDDGMSGDDGAGDGIYAARATIPSSALGVLPVDFMIKDGALQESRTSLVQVVSSLKVVAEVSGVQKLGDVVIVRGNASSLGKPANGEAVAEFYAPSGKLAYTEKGALSNGSFVFSYHGTLADELGNWSVRVNATDEFENSGPWSGSFLLAKLAPGSFLDVEHVSPVVGAYSRGSTVSVSVRVKRDGESVSGAKVFFITPTNLPVEMSEVGNGIYGATYTIKQDDPLGAWTIISRASSEFESGTVEGGASYKVRIVPSTLRVEITRPERGEFAIGDNIEIVALAKYPDGDPVNATSAFVVIGSDRIHMEQPQQGAFVAYYTTPEGKEGEEMLTVEIEDSFGNTGSKSLALSVSGTSLLYTLDRNRFLVIPAAIAIIIGLFTFCKNCIFASKKDRLLKRKEQLLGLQAKLQEQYLKQGSVDRKTFYDLSANYDSELQRIEHELAEMEEKKIETGKKETGGST